MDADRQLTTDSRPWGFSAIPRVFSSHYAHPHASIRSRTVVPSPDVGITSILPPISSALSATLAIPRWPARTNSSVGGTSTPGPLSATRARIPQSSPISTTLTGRPEGGLSVLTPPVGSRTREPTGGPLANHHSLNVRMATYGSHPTSSRMTSRDRTLT